MMAVIGARGGGGKLLRFGFPSLERKLVPSFSWGSLPFRVIMGRHPFREEKKRFPCALASGERERPPPLY